MMRLGRGRRASLLVAFFLLTSAATADAECAWVLWAIPTGTVYERGSGDTVPQQPLKKKPTTSSEIPAPKIVGAYETRDACSAHPWVRQEPLLADGSRGEVQVWVEVSHKCLPDTVDPRGPKGK